MARLAAFVLVLTCGCEPASDVRLLELHRIEPTLWEPNTTVTVSGDGFPPRNRGRATLSGTLFRPGESPAGVEFETTVHAVSSELATFRVPEPLLTESLGRATFRGLLKLTFDGAHADSVVSGHLEGIVIDLEDQTPGRYLQAELRRTRASAQFVASVGAAVEETPGSPGVLVRSVDEDGPAHRQGLREGDRIVEAAGIRVAHPSDISMATRADRIDLGVQRPGQTSPIRIGLSRARNRGLGSWFDAGALSFSILILVLLFFAPTARASQSTIAVLSDGARLRHSFRWLVGRPLVATRRSTLLAGGVRHGFAALAITLAFAAFPIAARFALTDVDVSALMGLAVGIQLVSVLASKSQRSVGRVATVGRDSLIAALSVASVAGLIGSFGMEALVASQSGLPWSWNALQTVPGALGVVAVTCAATQASEDSFDTSLAERLVLLLWSGIAATVFLGGWSVPWGPSDPLSSDAALRLIGLALFCAKAWGFAAVAVAVARSGRKRARVWLGAISAAGAVLFAVGHATGAWPDDYERFLGPLVAVIITVLFTAAGARSIRGTSVARLVYPTLR